MSHLEPRITEITPSSGEYSFKAHFHALIRTID